MLANYVHGFPFDSFALGLILVALPYLAILRGVSGLQSPPWVRWYRRLVAGAAIALALTASARYLAAALPEVDGLDFYFYLCFARDALHGVVEPSPAKYAYFPGGYRFWEFAMRLVGENLQALQFVFIGLLAANAALCAMIAARCVKSAVAGVMAGLWYLALASRFEGLDGTTEPIATLFALLGLLAWGGEPLRGSPGLRRALLLGAGLGMAAWIKQQGGLVALGVAALAFNYMMDRPAVRDRLSQLFVIPACAACVFVLAMLMEGQGLVPLQTGLHHVVEYEPLGSMIKNLVRLATQSGPAVWFFLLALYFWIALLLSGGVLGRRQAPWAAVVGYCLVAAIATFIQFSKRSSPHYGLLAAPYISIAIAVTGMRAMQSASTIWPRLRPFFEIAAVGALSLPMVGSMGKVGHFQVWPPVWNPIVEAQRHWHEFDDVAPDIEALATVISPGDSVLVLPPRRNVIHYLVGSVSLANPHRYGWGGDWDVSRSIRTPGLDAVVVLHPRSLEQGDSTLCAVASCYRAIAELPDSGFDKAVVLPSMTVWRSSSLRQGP